jgi:hypothetical protein
MDTLVLLTQEEIQILTTLLEMVIKIDDNYKSLEPMVKGDLDSLLIKFRML